MATDVALLPRPMRVVSNARQTRDVVTLELEPTDGAAPLDFMPGQFNMLLQLGVGEVPLSISSATDSPLLGHTIRDVGAVTQALCRVKPGDLVGLRGPFGQPWPLSEAVGRDLVFVAGGIGLAPLRPALMSALTQRERYDRLCLLYGSRTPEDLLFLDDLQRWQSEADQVLITVDVANEDWGGDVGLVTSLLNRTPFNPANTAALICGPEIMMRFTARALMEGGVRADLIAVSLERSFSCARGLCGRCQLGSKFVCKDGPVFRYPEVIEQLAIAEL